MILKEEAFQIKVKTQRIQARAKIKIKNLNLWEIIRKESQMREQKIIDIHQVRNMNLQGIRLLEDSDQAIKL